MCAQIRLWSATDKDGESVALKFLERNNSEKVLKRFKNETFFCMFYKHPNILSILDYGTAGSNYIFYVMPLFNGTLRDRMKEGIEPEEACKIFTGILEGLNISHKLGTIMGYETQRLQKYDRNIMAMPMRVDEQKSTIKRFSHKRIRM